MLLDPPYTLAHPSAQLPDSPGAAAPGPSTPANNKSVMGHVGWYVGPNEGTGLGALLGTAVGERVGTLVGFDVGDVLGLGDGSTLGVVEGDRVGST